MKLLLKELKKNKKGALIGLGVATLVSTIIAGIISTNIVTPIIRNNMAAVTQKKMLE